MCTNVLQPPGSECVPQWLGGGDQAVPGAHALHHHDLHAGTQCQVSDLSGASIRVTWSFWPQLEARIDIVIPLRGWGKAGVNHKLIFELDPRQHASYQVKRYTHLFLSISSMSLKDVLSLSLMLAVLWCLSLILFIFADYLCFPAFYSPLALMITYAVFLLNPFKVQNITS